MLLVKVKQEFYDLCIRNDMAKELLFNEEGRPCVLIMRLRYKEEKRDFVVPLRSNISKYTPKEQYFSLPPNPKTRSGNKHGIHYIKLFPIEKKYIDTYVTDNNKYYDMILKILKRKEKEIVQTCQMYLDLCMEGKKHTMTPDLDGIIEVLRRVGKEGKE